MSKELIERVRLFIGEGIGNEIVSRIEELEKERDQLREQVVMLRDVLAAMQQDSDECLDFDECTTAMLVPMDSWHRVFETLATTEPKL